MIRFFKNIWDRIGYWILFLPFIIVPVASLIIGIVGAVSELKAKHANDEDVAYIDYYGAGYSAGWVDGKTEADLQWTDYGDEMYAQGFEEGYQACYEDDEASASAASNLEWEAVDYAREKSGWSPEEAWCVIEAYQNNEPWYQDGSAPTAQDYSEAIDSLIYFYEYFYGGHYE